MSWRLWYADLYLLFADSGIFSGARNENENLKQLLKDAEDRAEERHLLDLKVAEECAKKLLNAAEERAEKLLRLPRIVSRGRKSVVSDTFNQLLVLLYLFFPATVSNTASFSYNLYDDRREYRKIMH